MNLIKKITALLLTFSLLVVFAVGCNSSSDTSTDSSDEETSSEESSEEDEDSSETAEALELNVTKSVSSPYNPLVQVAEEEGYFEEYGLTISYTILDTSGMFESLSVGKIDTTYNQLVPALSYGAQGSDITVFGGTVSGGMAAFVTEENYEYYSDLSNWSDVTIGVIQQSTSELVTKYVLTEEYGYSEDELNYSYIDEYANVILAVQKGTVDVGFVAAQYIDSALDQGLVELFPLTELMEDFVCCRQSAYTSSLEDNHEAFVAYLKGQIKAYKVYVEDQETTLADVAAATGEDEDSAYAYIYDADNSANRQYNPDPNYNGVLADYEIFISSGYAEEGVELYEFFDIATYAEALQEVIAENEGETFYEDMWTYFIEHNDDYPDFAETYES